jgi:hypothetical protein
MHFLSYGIVTILRNVIILQMIITFYQIIMEYEEFISAYLILRWIHIQSCNATNTRIFFMASAS